MRKKFGLLKYFSFITIIGFFIILLVIFLAIKTNTKDVLKYSEEQFSEEFAEVLSRDLFNILPPEKFFNKENIDVDKEKIESSIIKLTEGTKVSSVVFFDNDRSVVMSYLKPLSGEFDRVAALNLKADNPMSVLRDSGLLVTYKVIKGSSGDVLGTLAIASDYKSFNAYFSNKQYAFLAVIFGILLALFRILFLLVKKSDGLLQKDSETLEIKYQDLSEINNGLSEALEQQKISLEQANLSLEKLAFFDHLTGLPNKLYLYGFLEKKLRSSSGFSLILVNLDYFHNINDTLGHFMGDKVLIHVGNLLRENILNQELIVRFAGDEFGIVVDGVDESMLRNIGLDILHLFNEPFNIEENDLFLSCSIGISKFPFDGDDSQIIIRNASAALMQAKHRGKGQFMFYDETFTKEAVENLKLEQLLREAIKEDNGLKLFYQPLVDIKENKIFGAEALLRWYDSELGFIAPTKFIPLAEETGLIIPLGYWAITEACRQIVSWSKKGINIEVSVNISLRQLEKEDFLEKFSNILLKTGVKHDLLVVEITESSLSSPAAFTILEKIRELGIKIALDDFGTGYSSLSHLKNLPVQKIKVDRSFVINCVDDLKDKSIIKTIVSLSNNFNLRINAEGVESQQQKDYLLSEGFDEVQGFLYSVPLPAEDFILFLDKFNFIPNGSD